jgi:hypothetical protein
MRPTVEQTGYKVVDDMLERAAYDEYTREFFALLSKKTTLESSMSQTELVQSDAYSELEAELESVSQHLNEARDELLAGQDTKAIFREPPEWR